LQRATDLAEEMGDDNGATLTPLEPATAE